MPNDFGGPPDYISVYNPQPPIDPGDVPYRDYFVALYPGAKRPRNEWTKWRYLSAAMNITTSLWEARERARFDWESSAGDLALLIEHPAVVLWLPWVAHGACLKCNWIGSGVSSIDDAAASARAHSIALGAAPDVVARVRVPISERNGPFDRTLGRRWA
jgi:hypothetical protein